MFEDHLVIYDSGLGGISVVKELLEINPKYTISYIADTKMFPLGEKSFIEIQERLKQISKIVFSGGSSLMVLACNSATVSSIRELQARFLPESFKGKNIIGVSSPLLELMRDESFEMRDDLIVILSTQATFRAGFYQSEFLKYGFRNFIQAPSPKLAPAIESSKRKDIYIALEESFKGVDLDKVKMVVLGCTHYHFAKDIIQDFVGSKVKIIDPTLDIAKKLDLYIKNHPQYIVSKNPSLNIYATSDLCDLDFAKYLGCFSFNLKKIDL